MIVDLLLNFDVSVYSVPKLVFSNLAYGGLLNLQFTITI